MITPFDGKILTKVSNIQGQIEQTQDNLFSSHPECACDEKSLCAFHAGIHNHLERAKRHLQLAIDAIRSDDSS